MTTRTGVLALSYGTPSTRDEVAGYYTRIRHGREPTAAQLADLVRRYDAIGGLSPLNERTAEQVAGIARELDRSSPGRFVVGGATKYASPTIEEGVEHLIDEGVGSIVGLVLAPLSAEMSTGQYHDRAHAAASGRVRYDPIWTWWDAAGFAELLADRVRLSLAQSEPDALVVFTAHSLPSKVAAEGGDYPAQLAAVADRIAHLAGLDRHVVCFQSAGRTQDEWLGPDLIGVVRDLDARSTSAVVVCPVGFVSDHLEVLYDIDIEARDIAAQRGIALRRTTSLNADPAFLCILADLVLKTAGAK